MILPGKQTHAARKVCHASRPGQAGVSAILACSPVPGNRATASRLFTFNFRSSHNIYRKNAHFVSCILRVSANVNIPGWTARHLN